MIPEPIRTTSLGLGVTLAEAEARVDARLRGDGEAIPLDFLNIGFPPGDLPSPSLGGKLAEAGMWSLLHAVDINLASPPASERVKILSRAAAALDSKWVEEDLGLWLWGEAFLGAHQLEPPLTSTAAQSAAANVRVVQRSLDRPFLVENPPIYLAIGDQDMWAHLYEVAAEAGSGIVLDVGHMIGAHVNGDRPLRIADRDWGGWPLVREIHLSGFEITSRRGRNCWTDRHSMPFPQLLLDWADDILDRLPNPVAVTLELDGSTDAIVEQNLQAVLPLVEKKRRLELA